VWSSYRVLSAHLAQERSEHAVLKCAHAALCTEVTALQEELWGGGTAGNENLELLRSTIEELQTLLWEVIATVGQMPADCACLFQ
jgi:hypothetical protein